MTHQLTDEAKRLLEEYGSARWNAGFASASFDKLGEKRYGEEADECRAALLAHLAQRGTSEAVAWRFKLREDGPWHVDEEKPTHPERLYCMEPLFAASPQAQPMPDGGAPSVAIPADLARRVIERLEYPGPSWAEHRAALAAELRAASGVALTDGGEKP